MGQSNLKLAPTQLEDLLQQTSFTTEQLNQLYETFRRDFPSGYITKSEFAGIYKNFYKKGEPLTFSEHVFRAFDANSDGKIDFREFICSLSLTIHGTVEDKLRWAFSMYDLDGDGTVSMNEICNIVRSVQKLINANDVNLSYNKIHHMFEACDKNADGRLTVDEFIKGSKSNPIFMKLLTDYVQ